MLKIKMNGELNMKKILLASIFLLFVTGCKVTEKENHENQTTDSIEVTSSSLNQTEEKIEDKEILNEDDSIIDQKNLTEQQAIEWATFHFKEQFGDQYPIDSLKTELSFNSMDELVITFYDVENETVITSYRINDQGFLMGHTNNLGHYVVSEEYDVGNQK